MPIYSPPITPKQFQKAMIFIDGTNLFCRLVDHKIILNTSLANIVSQFVDGRQIIRMYLYTNGYKLDEAKKVHGNYITDGIRIVFGEGIPLKDGNIREKGVDALLVADLVYHAAVKNYDYALLVSTDTDFVHALRRVEDFGCTTGVLGLCSELPERLSNAADQSKILTKEDLINNNWVKCKPIN